MSLLLPEQLPILPLYDKVLLPSIVTNFVLSDTEANHLIKHDLIVCIPLKKKNNNSNSRGDGINTITSATAITAADALNDDLSRLYHFGCTAEILKVDQSLPGTTVLHVQGLCRSRILDIIYEGACFEAVLKHYFFTEEDEQENEEDQDEFTLSNDNKNKNDGLAYQATQFRILCKEYITRMQEFSVSDVILLQLTKSMSRQPLSSIISLLFCLTESTTLNDKLRALETVHFQKLLELGNQVVSCHLQCLRKSTEMQQTLEQTLDKHRREFYLRHQFHSIERNQNNHSFVLPQQSTRLSTGKNNRYNITFKNINNNAIDIIAPSNEDDEELADLVNQLNKANLPPYAKSVVIRDLKRLRKLMPSTPESGILRSYLELVAALPWQQQQQESTSIGNPHADVSIAVAQKHLDADHYGLEQVKRRILEYLSVIKVKKDLSPPILCLVGPPGVGKTTLARSIATALNRKFYRMSLGSIRDEAEIRGHRRTYVAAMPGLLINGMRKCGVKNPVILLDEIDKMVQNSHQGDPAAALLEVLDPSQNSTFMDHFLNIPFDLSQVLFIATANSMDTISGPLLDRMEVVHLSGYTTDEKIHIARSYLWPKQLEAHGLSKMGIELSDSALLYVIEHYTQESGVRNLDRNIASLCRYKCKEYADMTEKTSKPKKIQHHLQMSSPSPNLTLSSNLKSNIDVDDIHTILGAPRFEFDMVDGEESLPGVVFGLAYAQGGLGGILPIEVNQMPGRGRLTLTGSLGDVLKESAYIAISWIKSNAYVLGLTTSRKEELLSDMDLHIHMPNGALPKEGPSAGITMVMAIVSLLSGKPVPKTTAMTGEITLRGQIRAIGGVKEKVISAHRAGVERILLPVTNQRDILQDVPENIRQSIKFVYCKSLWDAVEACFDYDGLNTMKCSTRYASHL
ncbi:Lon protease C-terminal proteolytic domain-containing protein [Phascolomyces articulosus]|uniref:Lon protease homolog n=1 Tax=Phascolomyces articulosus TaxID=60185 RepID=A0AAD5PKF4_9FUNG|nr:Lon protease C-terminal proteolytic domain-containing protein [Phascolomyces articulosus]